MRCSVAAFIAMSLLNPFPLLAESPLDPARSDYLETEGGGFMLQEGGVMYAMTFAVQTKVTRTIYATVEFENPSDKSTPYTVDLTIEPNQTELFAASPSISRIANHRNYEVKVLLFSDQERTQAISQHSQMVNFRLPPGLEKTMGIELIR